MNGLTHDQISDLLGSTKSRNQYGPKLAEFMNSDEAAIDVASVWPVEFGKKSASTLYQGFNNAARNAALTDKVMIKQHDDHVFLLNRERVNALTTTTD